MIQFSQYPTLAEGNTVVISHEGTPPSPCAPKEPFETQIHPQGTRLTDIISSSPAPLDNGLLPGVTPSASSHLKLRDQRTKTAHQISNYDKGRQQRHNSLPSVRVRLRCI